MENIRESVGRACHAAAQRVLVEQGYCDHVFEQSTRTLCHCGKPPGRHHEDLAPWEALSEERRAYFRAVGEGAIPSLQLSIKSLMKLADKRAGERDDAGGERVTELESVRDGLVNYWRDRAKEMEHLVGIDYLADYERAKLHAAEEEHA